MRRVTEKEAYENLANAIILTHVKDYKRALKHLMRSPKSTIAVRAVEEGERFIRSEWFSVLTDINPEYLINKIREEMEEKRQCI